jgi:DNA-binding beta-propeller fold protein YncE
MNHRPNHRHIRTRLPARMRAAARRAGASGAALLALLLPAAAPGTAHAQGRVTIVPSAQTRLELPGFAALVADDATRSVFVSSGASGGGVEEVGYDGAVTGSFAHGADAEGMVLSADGRTLYLALGSGDAVAAIDTGTFIEKARYPLPRHSCPTNLARTGPDVWIGYGCGTAGAASGVGVLPTDAAAPQVALDRQEAAADARYSAAPIVAASARAPGVLVVSRPYLKQTTVSTYAASSGPDPSLRLVRSAPWSGSELADLALSPDGATAFAASGSQTTVDALTASTLAVAGRYPTGLGPDAIAVSADGSEIAATTAIPGSHVHVWALGGPGAPLGDYGRPDGGAPAPRGLAFSGDGRLLFFVTDPPSGRGAPTLTVLGVDEG